MYLHYSVWLQYTPFLKISEENIVGRAELVIMAIVRDTGVLARDHLLQFRLVPSPQCDGHCCIAHLCVVGSELTGSDPGAGPPPYGGLINISSALHCATPLPIWDIKSGRCLFFQSRSTITA